MDESGETPMIVRDAVQEYLSSIRRKLEQRTQVGYQQRLGVFADWCTASGISLEHFSKRSGYRIVDDFIEYLITTHPGKKGQVLSSTTVRGYVISIKVFLRWCLRKSDEFEEYINPIILERVEIPKIERKVVETFSDRQVTAMLAACELEYNEHLKLRNRAILSVLIGTGIRVHELCGLTIECTHTEVEDAHIKVFGKGRMWREVPLDEDSRKLVGRYLRRFRAGVEGSAPLFVDKSESRALTRSGIEQLFEKLGRIAHVTGVRCSPHTARHTYATRFMAEGGNPYHLQKCMGHETFATTEKYLKTLPPRDIRAALRRVK